MEKRIPLSFNPKGKYKDVIVDDFGGITWLDGHKNANKAVGSGEIQAFNIVAFKVENLLDILPNEDSRLGLYHILVPESAGGRASTLVAVELDSYGNEIGTPESSFVGVPVEVNFKNSTIDYNMINFVSKVNGLTWLPGSFGPTKIQDWLLKSRQQDSIQRSVDMILRVRFSKYDLLEILEGSSYIGFALVLFKCYFKESDFDDDGPCCNTFNRYCTLMPIRIIGNDNDTSFEYESFGGDFLVSSDAWRPNYPKFSTLKSILRQEFLAFRGDLMNFLEPFSKSIKFK